MSAAGEFTITILTHKGDVLVVITQPVAKLGFTADEAEALANKLLEAVKAARAEAPPEKGRKPS